MNDVIPKLGERKPCSSQKEYLNIKHTGPSFDLELLTGREFCMSLEHILLLEQADPDSFEVMPDGWIKMKKDVTLGGIRITQITRETLEALQPQAHKIGVHFKLVE